MRSYFPLFLCSLFPFLNYDSIPSLQIFLYIVFPSPRVENVDLSVRYIRQAFWLRKVAPCQPHPSRISRIPSPLLFSSTFFSVIGDLNSLKRLKNFSGPPPFLEIDIMSPFRAQLFSLFASLVPSLEARSCKGKGGFTYPLFQLSSEQVSSLSRN